MALFESYDRRINQINATLNNMESKTSTKQKLSAMQKASTLTTSVKKHSPSVLKMQNGPML